MTRFYRRLRAVLLTTVAAFGVLSILVVAAGLLFSVSPLIVMSGSMEPGIPTGSLLFVAERPASSAQVGDIVTVERQDGYGSVTHRVVSVEPAQDGATTLRLKGDANVQEDPDPYTQKTLGRFLFAVPGLGAIAGFFQTVRGLLVAALGGLAVVALYIFEPNRMAGLTRSRGRRRVGVPPGAEPMPKLPATDRSE